MLCLISPTIKRLFLEMAKKILPYVEEECDRCEKPCSMMYDEYPDKLQLHMMCSRIFDNVCKNEKSLAGYSKKMQDKKTDWLGNLIEVMLYQELYKRRCEERRIRRKFY